MEYKSEQKIPNRIVSREGFSKERIFREIAFSFVMELPIEKIIKLFNLKAHYGFEDNLIEAYKKSDHHQAKIIEELLKEDMSLFTGDIVIKD